MNLIANIIQNDFLFKFIANILCIFFILKIYCFKEIYAAVIQRSFFLFGTGVFLLTSFLYRLDMSIGFAFGIFAIFSMLRYRTESLSIRDMTYLFTIIAVSLLNSVSALTMIELALVNFTICLFAVISDRHLFSDNLLYKTIIYEKVDLIHPDKHQLLVEDIQERIGYEVKNIDIGDIDFLRDTVSLKIYYSSLFTEEKNKGKDSILSKPSINF